MGNTDTQESPRPGLGRNHHLPPYSILCTSPQSPHSNDFLSQDSQVGVPKSPRLGLPRLWGAITLRANLGLKWGLKQSCSPRRELFNGVSHAMCTHRNRVHSRLLVVGSQTANLTLDLSFGHNLCFKCPNGRCELILDIFIPIAFHWYKERLNPLSFDAYNRPLKFGNPLGLQLPKWNSLGVWGFIPSHLLTLPGVCCATPGFPLWPATLQTLALVTSPRLRLRQEHCYFMKVVISTQVSLETRLTTHVVRLVTSNIYNLLPMKKATYSTWNACSFHHVKHNLLLMCSNNLRKRLKCLGENLMSGSQYIFYRFDS